MSGSFRSSDNERTSPWEELFEEDEVLQYYRSRSEVTCEARDEDKKRQRDQEGVQRTAITDKLDPISDIVVAGALEC